MLLIKNVDLQKLIMYSYIHTQMYSEVPLNIVQHDMILNTAHVQKLDQALDNRHPIAHTPRWAMGCYCEYIYKDCLHYEVWFHGSQPSGPVGSGWGITHTEPPRDWQTTQTNTLMANWAHKGNCNMLTWQTHHRIFNQVPGWVFALRFLSLPASVCSCDPELVRVIQCFKLKFSLSPPEMFRKFPSLYNIL